MNAFALILIASPILLIAVLIFLVLIVSGIRRADRASLRNRPGHRLDSITRHLVGGVRNASRDDEDGDAANA
jgi:formate hydrogenlyase subunit 4